MDFRPRYRPEWTPLDKLVEILSWVLLILTWAYVLVKFFSLPDAIPVHFNARGEADGYGNKYMMLLLPAVITGVFILLQVVCKKPWQFNYIVTLTERNYQVLYRDYTRAIRIIKLVITAFALYVSIQAIRGAVNGNASLHAWALPLFIAAILIPSFIVIWRSLKYKS